MSTYKPLLSIIDTEKAIKFVKDTFEDKLAEALNLQRVSAPLFVKTKTGLNDDLNGVERAVKFDIKGISDEVAIVQSLAKWKRFALKKYQFGVHSGLYTDMNAIRRDEDLDELHSVYVDQWDWEAIIVKEDRNLPFIEKVVKRIYRCIKEVQMLVVKEYPVLVDYLPEDIYFITSQQLLDLYPNLSVKERENEIAKKYGAVFIEQIGYPLSNGIKHDGRAPDYDDWKLNGDIIVYYPPLNKAVELSSMGIRVDGESLKEQLTFDNKQERMYLPFHSALLNGELPLTIGGGIGQSRLCFVMLNKIHIGEVQSSIWYDDLNEDYIL
jgi:aspartate--ammonia ligase